MWPATQVCAHACVESAPAAVKRHCRSAEKHQNMAQFTGPTWQRRADAKLLTMLCHVVLCCASHSCRTLCCNSREMSWLSLTVISAGSTTSISTMYLHTPATPHMLQTCMPSNKHNQSLTPVNNASHLSSTALPYKWPFPWSPSH